LVVLVIVLKGVQAVSEEQRNEEVAEGAVEAAAEATGEIGAA
jgi:hypothetical protein